MNRTSAELRSTLRRHAAGLLVVLASLAPDLHAAVVTVPVYMGTGTGFSRTRSTSTTATTLAKGGGTATWTLSPTTASALTIPAGATLDIYLSATCSPSQTARTFDLTLDTTGGTTTTLGSVLGTAVTFTACNTYQTLGPYTVTIGASPVNLAANTALRLRVTNQTTGGGPNARDLLVRPSDGTTSITRVEYDINDPLTVTSITPYTAAHPSGSADTGVDQGSTTYIRAVVSNVFGNADISETSGWRPTITVTGPSPSGAFLTNAIGSVSMNAVDMGTAVAALQTTGTKTFEYALGTAETTSTGDYTMSVAARQGISAEALPNNPATTANLRVRGPFVALTKLSVAYSDPVNTTSNPKRIPGGVITHTITPQSTGEAASGTVVVYEQIDNTNLEYDVTYGVTYSVDTSGLSASAPTVTYSSNDCASFVNNVTPSGSYDPTVRCIRIAPSGTFAANTGTPPYFTLTYRTRVR